ncbi:MAG: RlmE family RNA methyltransferase [Phycisphaerales bacterium]
MRRKDWNDDAFTKRAQREGYLARSAYKLLEIDEKKRLLRPGASVLDLGCAPGAWLQVASRLVGPKGRVVGIDLQPVRARIAANVRTLVGDIDATAPETLLAELVALGAPEGHLFDCVLSDMAPSTGGGGGGSADHFRSVHLCERVLDLLPGLLRPGGNLAMKVFEGEAYPDLLARTAGCFEKARGFKPKASRDASREMYIVAHAFRPPRG